MRKECGITFDVEMGSTRCEEARRSLDGMLWQRDNLGSFRWQKRHAECASPMPAFGPVSDIAPVCALRCSNAML